MCWEQVPQYPKILPSIINPGAFAFSEDTNLGHLTLENDLMKVVWNYKTRAGDPDHGNRSGGNIYGLYDKRTDPDATHNLVAETDFGTGGTSPPMAGIGGLGATHMWESGSLVATSDNANFGRMVSHNSYIDAEGNAVFDVSFIVRSNINDRPDNYRVDKRWEVHPDGQIKLTLNLVILRDHEIKEPAYNFSFNRDYGWTTASSIGHNWVRTICGGIGSRGPENSHNTETVINNIDTASDYDNQLLHARELQSIWSAGRLVRQGEDGQQRRWLRKWRTLCAGRFLWDTTANPTVEYTNYKDRAHGHTLRFYGWWGGAINEQRYKLVRAGTSWSDTIWIEMIPSSSRASLQIVNGAAATQTAPDEASVDWATNASSSSEVSFQPRGGGAARIVRSDAWEPNHKLTLTGLEPGKTYDFEVKSREGLAEATAEGTVAMSAPGATLSLSSPQVYWQNYQNYHNRLLTVNFDVTNVGEVPALSVRSVRIIATGGVHSDENVAVGDLAPGESRP